MGNHHATAALPTAARDRIQVSTRSQATTLDLSRLDLSSLPDDLSLKHVCALDLAHNRITHLPAAFGRKWRRLTSLHLAHNALTALPSEAIFLTRLQILDLDGNLIAHITPDLSSSSSSSSASSASASTSSTSGSKPDKKKIKPPTSDSSPQDSQDPHNTQDSSPSLHFPQLETLRLAGNVIVDLSVELWGMANLKELVLERNLVSHIAPPPTQAMRLAQLQSLKLARNALTSLDLPLASLMPALQLLDLSNNQLSFLHPQICPTTLTALDLSDNRLVDLPPLTTAHTALHKLVAPRNSISLIPDSIIHAAHLSEIDLADNLISRLADSLMGLSALQSLDLSKNRISNLPQDLSALSALSKLSIVKNAVSLLPNSITALSALKHLNLTSNHISLFLQTTADDVESARQWKDSPLMNALEEVYLSFNALDAFPAALLYCTKLHTLGLAYNAISSLPEDLPRLVELKYLFLSGNQIWNIPFELRDMTNLKWLYINNNSMRTVPQNLNDFNCDVKDVSGNHVLSMNAGNLTPKEETNTGRRRSNCFRGAAIKQSRRFKVSHAEMIGRRPYMEDAVALRGCFRNRTNEDFFAVFDGHGSEGTGKKAAEYLTMYLAEDLENALIEAFKPYAVKALPAHLAPPKTSSYRDGGRMLVGSVIEEGEGGISNVASRFAASEGREARGLSGRRNLQSLNVAVGENGAPVVQEEDDVQLEKSKEIEIVTQVITSTFEKTNESLIEQTKKIGDTLGATAAIAYIRKNTIYAANCGDSRTVVCRNGKAIQLSIDHKPHDRKEEERIRAAGGFVGPNGRMNGQIAVTRSFGDSRQRPSMIATPHIATFDFDSTSDPFLVIACDGVFDVLSNQEVIDCVLHELERDPTLSGAANKVRDMAYQYGSTDNISVMVIGLTSGIY